MNNKTDGQDNNPGQRLQKVTNSEFEKSTDERIKSFEETLTKERITLKNLPLDKEERKRLTDKIEEHIKSIKGSELDEYLDKIDAIVTPESDMRNQRWENTHLAIVASINNLTQRQNRLPTVTQIAEESRYSRKTIHAHLADFESSPFYQEAKQKFKILNHTVLSRVFAFAVNGDVRACRLFLEFTGVLKPRATIRNYIQINSMIVTEDLIKQLPEKRIVEIENLIRKAVLESSEPN